MPFPKTKFGPIKNGPLYYINHKLQTEITNFLIDKTNNEEDMSTLLSGLKLVGNYLDKTILKPNNLTQPISRTQFINTLK